MYLQEICVWTVKVHREVVIIFDLSHIRHATEG